MAQFMERVIRAARLDASLYEEVEADKDAMGQAVAVVVLSSLAAGIGSYVHGGMLGLVLEGAAALLGWYVWAYITYWIGTRILPQPQTQTSHAELLRTLGFASAPGLLRVLGVVPGLAGFAFLIAAVWMLVATVVAVRQALDYTSTARAFGVCVLGWLVQILILLPLFVVFGRGVAL